MSIGSLDTLPVAPRGPGLAAVTPPGGLPRGHDRPGKSAALSGSACSFDALSRAAVHLTFTCHSPQRTAMRKVLVTVFIIGSLASARAWSSRDANSAVCVAWEGPTAWRGSPVAADAKVLPEEHIVAEGRGRGLVQMLSGAVLLFLIGGMPFLQAGWLSAVSFVYRDLLVPDDEEDAQPLTARQLKDIFEQEVALPDRLPEPEPGFDQDSMDRLHAWNRRTIARQKIWIEWLGEQLAVLGVEEYDPAPIPYCQRSPCYEGPGFEVPLSDLDSDSDSDAD